MARGRSHRAQGGSCLEDTDPRGPSTRPRHRAPRRERPTLRHDTREQHYTGLRGNILYAMTFLSCMRQLVQSPVVVMRGPFEKITTFIGPRGRGGPPPSVAAVLVVRPEWGPAR